MKRRLNLFFIVAAFLSCQRLIANINPDMHYRLGCSYTESADTLVPYLTSLDLNYYNGKAVDTFLQKLPTGYSHMKVMDWDGSRYATYLWVKYDTIRILIFVTEFHHLNPRNHNRDWDISLFKKEKVACIEIWNRRQRISPRCLWWE